MPITQCSPGEFTVKGIGSEPCFIPKSDGGDYRDNEIQPWISDIGHAMDRYIERRYRGEIPISVSYDTEYVVVAIGKIKYGIRVVSGISKIVTTRSVLLIDFENITYKEKLRKLFDNHEVAFDHVSAFIVKPIT